MEWLVSGACWLTLQNPDSTCRTAAPITDGRDQVIGICAGRPDDPLWDAVSNRAAHAIDAARDQMKFDKEDVYHRRMDDPSKAVGTSHGGGQKVCLLDIFRQRSLT